MSVNGRLISFQDMLDQFKDICREGGLKLTHQRMEVYRELVLATDHPSAETVHQRVLERIPMIAVDTVYRTIATFERLGLVVRVHAFDDIGRFDADLSPHHHFVCTECKSIMDFHWEYFDSQELPDEATRWGRADDRRVLVRGVCRGCLARN